MKYQILIMNIGIAIALGLAIQQFSSGAYIHLKAILAQQLLERSWKQRQNGQASAKPWPWADTKAVMRLRIPSLNIDQIVLEGASGRTLAFGPGFMLASNLPGQGGTSVISGHRDTHFKFLQDLNLGDEIILETPDGQKYSYTIMKGEVADTRTSSLKFEANHGNLILLTCYPFNVIAPTGPLRYVLRAEPNLAAANF
ncbi:MAG TPA: class GN sortase [Trueperaceae bacterium]|nr:class GN sortase [Trueperaceae bacterium]